MQDINVIKDKLFPEYMASCQEVLGNFEVD